MMDWTDMHCRFFHRLLSRQTLLYTEMVTTGALIHGDVPRHLRFNDEEHPVALQLGGSEPADLAHCARLGQQLGLRRDQPELRLSVRAGAARRLRCLPDGRAGLVADCVKAMVDVVNVPVTVKHRIGIDKSEDYGFVRDFVGQVSEAGCSVFIVHARNAWLKGLSPKANREVPPLRYETVHRLKADFPHLTLVLNGGITTEARIAEHLQALDGVMLGREAYHNPWLMANWDSRFFGQPAPAADTRESIEQQMVDYMAREARERSTPWSSIARHMLGLRHGLPGARRWRQVWSDHRLRDCAPQEVMHLAHQPAEPVAAAAVLQHV